MRFSIFTPTHSDKYLDRLAASLERQTFKDFEWVLIPNGKNPPKPNYPNLNVKVVPFINMEVNSIGFLKLFACMQASGEILVEVDHDDELTPDCLEELNKAFDSETDFAYSNFANVTWDGRPFRYSDGHGWLYRPYFLDGKEYEEVVSFPPSPSAFSKIWYQPNHIRAWRKDHYFAIGGHNPNLDVLDDQDLMCKSYIAARKITHVDKCLYLYHVHPENTCYGQKNAKIQIETWNLHDKYFYAMCEKWATDNSLLKLDLGGAFSSPPGYLSVDLEPSQAGDPYPNIICDLNKEWRFKDGTVGVIRAHDILEHLKDPMHVMKEAYRVLAPNGYFLISVPSTDGRGAFQDPTHVSFWNSNSFWYYTRQETGKYIKSPVHFQELRLINHFPSDWHKEHNIVYTMAHLMKNEGRVPGLVRI